MFVPIILGYKPENYRCLLPKCDNYNSSYHGEQNYIDVGELSTISRDVDINVNQCQIRQPSDWSDQDIKNCGSNTFDTIGQYIICDPQHFDVEYSNFTMSTTIVTEFKLFCNEEYKVLSNNVLKHQTILF